MTTTDTPTPILEQWLVEFVAAGGNPGKGLRYVEVEAEGKAHQYDTLGTAYADFQPGNGTSYLMVLHDLVRPQAQAHYDRWDRPGEADNETVKDGRLRHAPTHVDECRFEAARLGMSGRAGGELLVSLPEIFGGRSTVLSVPGPYFPDWLGGHLHCGQADAVWLAAYLTYFADFVDSIRHDREPVASS
jgi:hypothetical protein